VLHPFERTREYVRALNATKLERLHAKPFLGSLNGHADGVYCMAKSPKFLTRLASGSADGELRLWDLSSQTSVWSKVGHEKFIKGVCFVPNEEALLSCGDDKTIKLWSPKESDEAKAVFYGKMPFSGIDHHRNQAVFATSGSSLDIW
jgi:WD repeat and SOF domain-containing protein 1